MEVLHVNTHHGRPCLYRRPLNISSEPPLVWGCTPVLLLLIGWGFYGFSLQWLHLAFYFIILFFLLLRPPLKVSTFLLTSAGFQIAVKVLSPQRRDESRLLQSQCLPLGGGRVSSRRWRERLLTAPLLTLRLFVLGQVMMRSAGGRLWLTGCLKRPTPPLHPAALTGSAASVARTPSHQVSLLLLALATLQCASCES